MGIDIDAAASLSFIGIECVNVGEGEAKQLTILPLKFLVF